MTTDKTFDVKRVLERAIRVLDEKIKSIMKPNPKEKPRYSKADFFTNHEAHKGFPMSKDTYYNYTAFVNSEKPAKNIQKIELDTFYNICTYADVSADYLLGFIGTKRKEPTAEMMKQDFGFSDEAMERLIYLKNVRPQILKVINFTLKNDEFWKQFIPMLSNYIKANEQRNDSDDKEKEVAVARYSLNQLFERLMTNIYNDLYNPTPKKLFDIPKTKKEQPDNEV